ncbi:hypothetical protein EYF80_038117 [Liparis tanakae]|uniref:Uncharacterized protein n=1 Tax=Liparis tanakae TaxID=230148 RepID=A0A4Z2GEV6_9TELE|nr:hypothetical protein EYF80_038117 [Liparis tanakae]
MHEQPHQQFKKKLGLLEWLHPLPRAEPTVVGTCESGERRLSYVDMRDAFLPGSVSTGQMGRRSFSGRNKMALRVLKTPNQVRGEVYPVQVSASPRYSGFSAVEVTKPLACRGARPSLSGASPPPSAAAASATALALATRSRPLGRRRSAREPLRGSVLGRSGTPGLGSFTSWLTYSETDGGRNKGVVLVIPVTPSGQRVMEVTGMRKAVGPVRLQVALAPVGRPGLAGGSEGSSGDPSRKTESDWLPADGLRTRVGY